MNQDRPPEPPVDPPSEPADTPVDDDTLRREMHATAVERLPQLAEDIETLLAHVDCQHNPKRFNSVRLAKIFASALRNEIKHVLR